MPGFVLGIQLVTPTWPGSVEDANGVCWRALAEAAAQGLHTRSPCAFCPFRSVLARLGRVDPTNQVEGIDQEQSGTPPTLVSHSSRRKNSFPCIITDTEGPF